MIDILIVGDNPLARMGLAALLAERDEVQVVAQLAADDNLPEMVHLHRTELLLWDVGWEPPLELLSHLVQNGAVVIALVSHDETAADLWRIGTAAILRQNIEPDPLMAAITAADQGLTVIDPELSEHLLPPERLPAPPTEELTPRELEVLQHLAEGLPNKAIARQLEISEHTVKFHVNAIMTKLGAQSRTEAVVRAMQLGLIIL